MGVEVGGQSLARGDTGVRCGVMRLPGVKGVRNREAADVGIGDQGRGPRGQGWSNVITKVVGDRGTEQGALSVFGKLGV